VTVGKSNAGHCVWVDLGGRLGFRDVPTEQRIYDMLKEGGVLISPGSSYHAPMAGWYRITFSVKRDALMVGLGRMEKILGLSVVNRDAATVED